MTGSQLSTKPRWIDTWPVLILDTQVTGATDLIVTRAGSAGAKAGAQTAWNGACLEVLDYDVYEREQEYFIQWLITTGAVAPAVDYYWTLFPITAGGGTAAARTTTLGAEVFGIRSATVTTPGASAKSGILTSPSVQLPQHDLYIPVIHFAGAMASTAYIAGEVRLGVISV